MSTFIVTGYIVVPAADLAAVRRELPAHQALTLAEPGCRRFEVTPCDHDPHRFTVYEEFTDRAAFEAHQARVMASHWGRVAVNVQRYYDIVE